MKYLVLFLCLISLAACTPAAYAPVEVRAIDLPSDEGAHTVPIEWWYYTGHIQAEDGKRYGFELTFFKAYTPKQLSLFGFLPAYYFVEKAHVGHFAITDIDGESFEKREVADFLGYPASAGYGDLDVELANWYAKRSDDGISHEISASLGDRTLRLTLTPEKPVSLHGDPPGIQAMGPGGTSYYLSYTRMKAAGELLECQLLSCNTVTVTGQGWHDHQWGDFNLNSYAGWDWFSVQLEDNTELMLYLIRQPDGTYSVRKGSYVTAEGETISLNEDDYKLIETGETWTSEDTGAIYPVGWRIEVPAFNIDISVDPVLLDQEMNTRRTTGIVYWEGAVDISGTHEGLGYVELTNYDLYPYGQTDETTPLKPLRGPLSSN